MTPEQKIKQKIVFDLTKNLITNTEEIEEAYDELDSDSLQDHLSCFREGEYVTDIPTDYSRHYESKSVASKMLDDMYVGWTYWFGGGKYGCPEEVEWMSYAYDLDCLEKEQMVIVRKWKKK